AAVAGERLEHVALEDGGTGHAQLLDVPVDRPAGVAVALDERRGGRATRERLETHRPGACEEIEYGRPVDGADQVERGLADAVRGGSRRIALRRVDAGSSVLACDDAHAREAMRRGDAPTSNPRKAPRRP